MKSPTPLTYLFKQSAPTVARRSGVAVVATTFPSRSCRGSSGSDGGRRFRFARSVMSVTVVAAEGDVLVSPEVSDSLSAVGAGRSAPECSLWWSCVGRRAPESSMSKAPEPGRVLSRQAAEAVRRRCRGHAARPCGAKLSGVGAREGGAIMPNLASTRQGNSNLTG